MVPNRSGREVKNLEWRVGSIPAIRDSGNSRFRQFAIPAVRDSGSSRFRQFAISAIRDDDIEAIVNNDPMELTQRTIHRLGEK
jgi:hypothetical protein